MYCFGWFDFLVQPKQGSFMGFWLDKGLCNETITNNYYSFYLYNSTIKDSKISHD